jgi:hypothetical protein
MFGLQNEREWTVFSEKVLLHSPSSPKTRSMKE